MTILVPKRLLLLSLKPHVQTASISTRVKIGACSPEVRALAPVIETSATELRQKQKLLKCKITIQIL